MTHVKDITCRATGLLVTVRHLAILHGVAILWAHHEACLLTFAHVCIATAAFNARHEEKYQA